MKVLISIWIIVVTHFNIAAQVENGPKKVIPLIVRKCSDFSLSGKGDDNEWKKTEWNYLSQLDTFNARIYSSKFKILYSVKGVYVLFNGEDEKISTQYNTDFGDLYRGDVFEVFFHTDPAIPIYFEYEINQLNKELVLLVPNINGKAHGWIPWRYKNERRIKKMVKVVGGKKIANAAITSWSAELFFPYELFSPLNNVPPVSGTIWHANFCRLDYDSGNGMKWSWSPVQRTFHEFEKYRSIIFE
jgi:hypothetical protein